MKTNRPATACNRAVAHKDQQRGPTAFPALILATILLFTVTCSLDYGQAEVVEELSEEIPDTIIYEFTHTVVRDGRPVLIVEAAESQTFSRRDTQLLSGIAFRELDRSGDLVTSGTANNAVYDTATQDVEITGNVLFFSAEEEATLTADSLFWDDENRMLRAEPEDSVRVATEEGTNIEGRGFEVDMQFRTMTYERGVRGRIILDGE